jgi:DNA-binding NarL/FixJ family response regulator
MPTATEKPSARSTASTGMATSQPRMRFERDEPSGSPESLTERELEILRLLASGYSNREIARALFGVTFKTAPPMSAIAR